MTQPLKSILARYWPGGTPMLLGESEFVVADIHDVRRQLSACDCGAKADFVIADRELFFVCCAEHQGAFIRMLMSSEEFV